MPELSPHPRVPSSSGSTFGQAMLEAQSLSNSHHYMSSHYPSDLFFRNISMVEPNLHGLVESEVFVGEEPNFLEDDNAFATGVIPSSLSISYHKDGFLQPLNSVKEDIEAEAAEEQLSGNFHSLDYLGLSLGPSSLSSSLISSNSLEDAMNQGESYNCVGRNHSNTSKALMKGIGDPKLKLKCIRQPNFKDTFSPGASARSSPRLVRTSPPHSARAYNDKEDSHLCDRTGCKGSPQKFYKNDKYNFPSDKKNPIWHNPSKADKLFGSIKKENISGFSFRREGSYRAKSEARELPNGSSKFSSLPRKKKEKSDKDIAAETYGTLGRNRKPRLPAVSSAETGSLKPPRVNSSHTKDLPLESKNILDKYATLPRKRAKEISARWKDQNSSKENSENNPSFQRSKSIGKADSSRSSRISPTSSSIQSSNSVHSPRIANNSLKQTGRSSKAKPISPSARLLARQNSSGKDRGDKTPSPGVYSSSRQPKTSKVSKKNAEVQVNIKWDPNEHELEDKLRLLTEEHSTLNTRLKRAEATADEVEQLRMEAVELRRTAEMEKMDKEELQEELDRTSDKVKDMLTSMEGVEREFNNRGESLLELENQLHNSTTINIKMQEKLNQYEDYSVKIRKDLDKSLAAQKILLQQVQDLEAEGREIAEFMSEEKNALSECLKEAELEICKQRKELEHLARKLECKDDETRHMVRLAEERRQGYVSLQTEMQSMQTTTQDMMVCQGAELSGASVGLTNLTSRLQIITEKLVQDYSISENDIENVVTPHDSDSSLSSSTNGTPQKSPSRSGQNRSPRKPVSFMQSFLSAISTAHSTTRMITSFKSKESQVHSRKSPDGSEAQAKGCSSSDTEKSVMNSSLSDQVTEVDHLVTRFLKVCCVLKSDADNILAELEDENERLCSQIQLHQQMIDQQYADVDSLRIFESNARKELKLVTKDLEKANQTLNQVCDEDKTKLANQKLEEDLVQMSQTLQRLETLHVERLGQMKHARHHLSSPNGTRNSPSKSSPRFITRRSLLRSSNWHKIPNRSFEEEDLEDKQPEIDYVVGHVLKTLEGIPDVLSTCPALKDLYMQLSASEPLDGKSHGQNESSEFEDPKCLIAHVGGSGEVNNKEIGVGTSQERSTCNNNSSSIETLTKDLSKVVLEEKTNGAPLEDCNSVPSVNKKEIAVDCNANPEIIVSSNSSPQNSDPSFVIPLLTHETSL